MRPVNVRGSKKVGQYVLIEKLGTGSFSTVYLGRHERTGGLCAIKSISRDKIIQNAKHQSNLKSEIKILEDCSHENIVGLNGILETAKHIYILLEYCAGGDLYRFIRKRGALKENICQRFSRQLSAGLKFLHDRKLAHRDLKPQNLLLTKKAFDAILKIADFGFARQIQRDTMAETMCGSPLYMAPEILKAQKYDSKADLWSSGAIIYQMIYGVPPFNGANHVALLRIIDRCKKIKFPAGFNVSEDLKDLIRKLLQRNPAERISFKDFFEHPWLKQPPTPDHSPLLACTPPYNKTLNTSATPLNSSRHHKTVRNQYALRTSSPLQQEYCLPSTTPRRKIPSPIHSDKHELNANTPPPTQDEKDDFVHVVKVERTPPKRQPPPNFNRRRMSARGDTVVLLKATLEKVRKKITWASALGRLADSKTTKDDYGEAITLYTHSCVIYAEVRAMIKNSFPDIAHVATLQLRTSAFPSSEDPPEQQLGGFFQWATYRSSEQIRKAKATIQHLRGHGILNNSVVSLPVYHIVFNAAKGLGKRAAVDELLHTSKVAGVKYRQAALLIQFLAAEPAASKKDKEALRKFEEILKSRASANGCSQIRQ